MRPLPNVKNLRQAVVRVIESNIADHYQPLRFISKTEYGNAPDLVGICTSLIHDAEVVEFIEGKIEKIPTLLTIEDFVCHHGSAWGFDSATIEQANANRVRFDQVAHQTRCA
jgi:hypothetical protein